MIGGGPVSPNPWSNWLAVGLTRPSWRDSGTGRHFLAQSRISRYDLAMIKLVARKFCARASEICATNLPASVAPAEAEIFSV
jgi:hypothetical protein